MNVSNFPVLALDAQGYPVGHGDAVRAVTRTFQTMVNELPESVYHLNLVDAEWIAGELCRRYVVELRKGMQR